VAMLDFIYFTCTSQGQLKSKSIVPTDLRRRIRPFKAHVLYVAAIDMLPSIGISITSHGNVITNVNDDPISKVAFRVVFSSRFAKVFHFQLEFDIIDS